MHRASCSLLAVLALAAACAQAAPVYKGNTAAKDNTSVGPGHFDSGDSLFPGAYIAADGGNTAKASGTADDHGTVFASALNAFDGVAAGSSLLTFTVTLVGAPLSGTVPVHVQASGYTLVSGSSAGDAYSTANAYAGFVLQVNGATLAGYSSSTYGGVVQPTLDFDQWIGLQPGDHVDVSMQVISSAGGGGGLPGYAEALIDPIFTIDPAYASAYQLEGVPQAAAVPEPASAGLGLAGLAVLAAAARRRARRGG